MGSKFANLQIQHIDPCIVEERMPGCIVRELSEGWVTVLHEDFQIGGIEREARKLSKSLDRPVLSVGYYDDDILVLQVFKQGKSVALHVSNDGYGYEAKIGNPANFQQSLELEEVDKAVIKEILKCENLDKKVSLLENLLGVTLWIDYQSIDEDVEDFVKRIFDKSIIYEYIEEMKAISKVKNQTRLKQRAEFEAMPDHSFDKRFRLPNASGDFIVNNAEVYELLTNGSYELTRAELERKEPKNLASHSLLDLPDGATICSGYGLHQTLYECDSAGDIKWKLEVEYKYVSPVLHHDHLYMHVKINDQSVILKVNRLGEIVSKFVIPTLGGLHWKTFLFDDQNQMFYCSTFEQDCNRRTLLYCFNEHLEVLAQKEIDDTSFDSVIDRVLGVLYLYVFQNEIVKVDVNRLQIIGRLKYTDYMKFILVDRNNRVYIQKGDSTLELLNPELQFVSRHRLKGQIRWHYINPEGNPCFVTWNGSKWDAGKEKSMVRVFEVCF